MIIYGGSNQDLKGIIEPLEPKIEKALRDMLGYEVFSDLDKKSRELLVPEAFYEPDTSTIDLAIDCIAESKSELQQNEFTGTFLFAANELLLLDEIFADEFTRRLAYRVGIDYEPWRNRFEKIKAEKEYSKEMEIAEQHQQQTESHFKRLIAERFVKETINWQAIMTQWISSIPSLKAAIESLSKIEKKPYKGRLIIGKRFSMEKDLAFATSVENAYFNKSSGRFYTAAGKSIVSSPVFLFPRDYDPQGLYGYSGRDFISLHYMHEYGHFITYAIQKTPIQAVSTAFFKTCT